MSVTATEELPYWDGTTPAIRSRPRFEIWDGATLVAVRRSLEATDAFIRRRGLPKVGYRVDALTQLTHAERI